MTEREQDLAVARAMGLNLDPDSKVFRWHDLPHYNSPAGMVKIIDHIQHHPNTDFAMNFILGFCDGTHMEGYERIPAYVIGEWRSIFERYLTPSLVKQIAYRAAMRE